MEFVWVVKRADLFDLHTPHGFMSLATARDEVERYVARARERGFFVERRHAEQDSSLKQIIPYNVLVRGTDVLLLQRSKKGGDARLFDKLSIGAGGHVNPEDSATPASGATDPIAACARRELDEELVIERVASFDPIGIINDDTNAVGSVHFGVVHVARVTGDVRVRETELLSARFVGQDELERLAADSSVNLETWSRLIVPSLRAHLPS
ncbi:MAG: NUDIX domain-containing protein [Planctomycetes bacterium]|nr:NUDIX domain-containing protein [Planctomycetota bacterium]MCC7171865.1 NUDIX domain-containing protein [Planctomycetota bacterium]